MSDAVPDAIPAEAPASSTPSAALRRAMLVAGALLYITGTIGSNIGPALLDDRPELVLALSSRNRNLFGSVPYIDWVPYAVIGFTRLLVVALVLYYIGQWFGHRALAWTENQLGELPAIYRWVERGVDRAGWALVVLMPGSNIVCMMAGHRRMAMRMFLPLLCLGLVIKLVALWIGGRIFEDQIRWFLDAIESYQWWIVGALFLVSILQSFRRASRTIDTAQAEEAAEHPAPPRPAERLREDGGHG